MSQTSDAGWNEPVLQAREFDSFDPESMTGSVQGSQLDHVQLAGGRFFGRLRQVQAGSVRIDWGRYNLPVRAMGDLSRELVTLGILGAGSGDGHVNGYSYRSPAIVMLPERADLYVRLPPDSAWLAIQAPRAVLESMGARLRRGPIDVRPLAESEWMRFNRSIADALAIMDSPSGTAGLLPGPAARYAPALLSCQDDLLAAFTRAFGPEADGGASPGTRLDRLRLVNRVEDYLDAHLSEATGVQELCAAASTNLHTLERAFMDILGTSPKRFVTLRRLARVRQELMHCRELAQCRGGRRSSVTEIATGWGFFHFGRFAADYRATFGELPSETLRPARQ